MTKKPKYPERGPFEAYLIWDAKNKKYMTRGTSESPLIYFSAAQVKAKINQEISYDFCWNKNGDNYEERLSQYQVHVMKMNFEHAELALVSATFKPEKSKCRLW